MNKYLTYISIFCLITSSSSYIQTLEPYENFLNINEKLKDSIIQMFSALKPSTNITDTLKNRLLFITVFDNFSNKTYETYKNVSNVGRLDLKFHIFKNTSLFKLDKPVEDIMGEDFNMKNYSVRGKSIQISSNSMEIPDNPEGIIKILGENITDARNFEMVFEKLRKPFQKLRELYIKDKHLSHERRKKFKVWEPSNSTEVLLPRSRKMFNSKQVEINKFPFVASIHVKNEFVCTGAIISRDMIITAASCLHETFFNQTYLQNHPHSITVRVGSNYHDQFGDVIEAVDFYICPDFDFETLKNNIAIIKIKKHLHLKSKVTKIRRIKYWAEKINSIKEVIMLGWGSKNNPSLTYKYKMDQLSYSLLNVMEKTEDCMKIYTKKFVSKNNFCAGYSEKRSAACQHDIGGPAVKGDTLLGLVSFAPPSCGSSETPTVFTNISLYRNWIDNIVKKKPQTDLRKSGNVRHVPGSSYYITKFHQSYADGHFHHPNAKLTRSPQAMKLISNILRYGGENPWYSGEDLVTDPDSHLWVTTTINLHRHPLINQSVYIIDYLAPIETEAPNVETTTGSTKPLDEAIIEYYMDDSTVSTNDSIKLQAPIGRIYNAVPSTRKLQTPIGRIYNAVPSTIKLQSPIGRIYNAVPSTIKLQSPIGRIYNAVPSSIKLQSPIGRIYNAVKLQSPFGRIYNAVPTTRKLQTPIGRIFNAVPSTKKLQAPIARIYNAVPSTSKKAVTPTTPKTISSVPTTYTTSPFHTFNFRTKLQKRNKNHVATSPHTIMTIPRGKLSPIRTRTTDKQWTIPYMRNVHFTTSNYVSNNRQNFRNPQIYKKAIYRQSKKNTVNLHSLMKYRLITTPTISTETTTKSVTPKHSKKPKTMKTNPYSIKKSKFVQSRQQDNIMSSNKFQYTPTSNMYNPNDQTKQSYEIKYNSDAQTLKSSDYIVILRQQPTKRRERHYKVDGDDIIVTERNTISTKDMTSHENEYHSTTYKPTKLITKKYKSDESMDKKIYKPTSNRHKILRNIRPYTLETMKSNEAIGFIQNSLENTTEETTIYEPDTTTERNSREIDSLINKTPLSVNTETETLSEKEKEDQKILLLLMEREIALEDKKYKENKPKSQINQNIFNNDNTDNLDDNRIPENNVAGHDQFKEIVFNLYDHSETTVNDDIETRQNYKENDNDKDLNQEIRADQMLPSNITSNKTENDLQFLLELPIDDTEYTDSSQKPNYDFIRDDTHFRNNKVKVADAFEVSNNTYEYPSGSYEDNRRSGRNLKKLDSPNFLEYIDF